MMDVGVEVWSGGGGGCSGVAGVEECVRALRRFATGRGVHVTAVIHPRKEGDAVRLSAGSIAGSAAAQAPPPPPRRRARLARRSLRRRVRGRARSR